MNRSVPLMQRNPGHFGDGGLLGGVPALSCQLAWQNKKNKDTSSRFYLRCSAAYPKLPKSFIWDCTFKHEISCSTRRTRAITFGGGIRRLCVCCIIVTSCAIPSSCPPYACIDTCLFEKQSYSPWSCCDSGGPTQGHRETPGAVQLHHRSLTICSNGVSVQHMTHGQNSS